MKASRQTATPSASSATSARPPARTGTPVRPGPPSYLWIHLLRPCNPDRFRDLRFRHRRSRLSRAAGPIHASLGQRPMSASLSRNPIDQGLKMANIEQGISNFEGFLPLLRFDIPCSVFDIPHPTGNRSLRPDAFLRVKLLLLAPSESGSRKLKIGLQYHPRESQPLFSDAAAKDDFKDDGNPLDLADSSSWSPVDLPACTRTGHVVPPMRCSWSGCARSAGKPLHSEVC